MKYDSKKFLDVLRQSLFSSFTMLFAGIILGSLLLPVQLDIATHYVVMILAMGLFTLGVYLQTKREQDIENDTNEELHKLKERLSRLENDNTKSDTSP